MKENTIRAEYKVCITTCQWKTCVVEVEVEVEVGEVARRRAAPWRRRRCAARRWRRGRAARRAGRSAARPTRTGASPPPRAPAPAPTAPPRPARLPHRTQLTTCSSHNMHTTVNNIITNSIFSYKIN